VSAAAASRAAPAAPVRVAYVLRLADTSLILAQRLGEWIGHAPALEEDLGLGNLALDFLGQARLLLTHAGSLEGAGRSEDDLAFLRAENEYRNFTLVEQPNGDFAHSIVRQFFIDAYQVPLFEALQSSADAQIAAVAAKSLKEALYHRRFSSHWLIRLGDGTEESHRRAQDALDALMRFTPEMFEADEIDRDNIAAGIGADLGPVHAAWKTEVASVLRQATLKLPAAAHGAPAGKRGEHSESMGYLLAEMQHMQRSFPGATW
jgi:ring-1,2-phenylacetyl-CoA epoxidase subunit PaaC